MSVSYYQCHNGTIITDGAGLIDIRINLRPDDSKCEGFLDVCCKNPDFIPPPPPKLVHKPKCGRRNINGIGARIAGFKEGQTQFAEWPHMCAVLHDKPTGSGESSNLYVCGGSLIAPGVILTAAHCIDKYKQVPRELKVRCGEWDTQQEIEPLRHEDRRGASVKIHPEFNGRNLANDYGLIFLSNEFELNFHIDTVCLPQPNRAWEGAKCFATGWGRDLFGVEGQYQVVLKEVDISPVSQGQCERRLKQTKLGKRFKLDDSFLCAGGQKGKDTCKGDGGSPLVCPRGFGNSTVYDQVGIVAWGIGCGEDGVPGVYADVSKAVCWIDQATTCYNGAVTGDYNNFFGYQYNQCGTWLQERLASFDDKISKTRSQSVKNVLGGLRARYAEYSSCAVNWRDENGGYEEEEFDLSGFARTAEKSTSQ